MDFCHLDIQRCIILFFSNLKLFSVTGELSQQGHKSKEDVSVLQKSVTALDREKDALQEEVDQKTEKLVALQEENTKKVFTF